MQGSASRLPAGQTEKKDWAGRHLGAMASAGQMPGTSRHAGMRAKKKGLETIQTLGAATTE